MSPFRIGLHCAGLALLLLVAPPTLGDSVYRCEQDGRIQFSDEPCDEDAQPERIRSGSSGLHFGADADKRPDKSEEETSDSTADEDAEAENASPCRDFTSTERRRLRVRGELVSGMTREDVREALGRPAEQHSEPLEVWIYAQRSRGYRVGETRIYFRDGCVARVE